MQHNHNERPAYRVNGRCVVAEDVRTCTLINARVIATDDHGRVRVIGARVVRIPVSMDHVITADVIAVEQLS